MKHWLSFSVVTLILSLQAQSDFYDVSKLKPNERKPQSPIIQFCYTTELNIGDYLPTLAIQKMSSIKTDLWNIAAKSIDFNFINKNYRCAIIGGAGILNYGFEKFYQDFLAQCTLPTIIWGSGILLPYGKLVIKQGLSETVAKGLEKKCDLINVRDELTRTLYHWDKAIVTPCPSVTYINQFRRFVKPIKSRVLYVSHDTLVPKDKNKIIIETIKKNAPNLEIITNNFKSVRSVNQIMSLIKKQYCRSSLVVTTKLHGAIIAYALGIPYIIIPFDEKLTAFYEKFGNGILVKDEKELNMCLKKNLWENIAKKPIDLGSINQFGTLAKQWIDSKIKKNK